MFLLEAMASGIPVIQPDKGAYPEIINTTGGGIVYREHTAAGLADAMKEVLLSPKTLNKFSESGYTAVHEAFSIERMADKLLQVYKC